METRQEYACLIHKVGLNSYVLVEDTNKYSMCQHTRTQMITQTRHTDVSVHPAVSSLKKILSLNSSVLFLDGWKEAWSGWPKYANTTVALSLLTQRPGPICSVAVIFRVKKAHWPPFIYWNVHYRSGMASVCLCTIYLCLCVSKYFLATLHHDSQQNNWECAQD